MPSDIPVDRVLASGAVGLVVIAMGVAGFVWAVRGLGARARVVAFGALVFVVSQPLTRLPLVAVAGAALGDPAALSQGVAWAWMAALALSAGVFEETGRALGYRFLLRDADPPTPRNAVAFGLGHGGIEAVLLVGVGLVVQAGMLFVAARQGLDALPAEAREPLLAQAQALAAAPAWTLPLAAVERALAIVLHVSLSVLVAVGFLRRAPVRWVGLAIVLHGATNLLALAVLRLGAGETAPGAAPVPSPAVQLATEVALALAVAGVATLARRALRGVDTSPDAAARAMARLGRQARVVP